MPAFAYSLIPVPLGTAIAVLGDDGLVALEVTAGDPAPTLARLSHELGAAPVRDELAGRAIAAQLGEYFEGERSRFDVVLDWRLVTGFHHDALRAVCTIAYGETASYGEVAILAGRPRAARAVGTACRIGPFSIIVPAHRVIRADGTIGEYGSRPDSRRFLVELERHALEQDTLIDRESDYGALATGAYATPPITNDGSARR